MVKTEVEKGRGFGGKWVWVMVALIGAFVAFAMSSKTSPKIAFFRAIDRACQCAKGTPKYSVMVEDCCCDYETVDHLNEEVLNPSLQELVKTRSSGILRFAYCHFLCLHLVLTGILFYAADAHSYFVFDKSQLNH